MKKPIVLFFTVILLFALTACSSKKAASEGNAGGARQDTAAVAPAAAPQQQKTENKTADMAKSSESASNATDEGRKIIYTANSAIDVKDLKGAYDSIISKTGEFGGYVANSSIRDTSSQITVRIPASKLEVFLKYLDTLGGEVKETSVSTSDITDQYTDSKSRLRNLLAQEEQLLGIMKKANTVEETLKIQNELFRVRGEIEAIQGKINMWDKLVEFSTVTVRLNKVLEIGEKEVKVSFISMSEIARGTANGFKMTFNFVVRFITGIFIVLVSLIPIVPFAALIAWIVIKIRKKSKKNIGQ